MKVAVWFDHNSYPENGGQSSYFHTFINAIVAHKFDSELDIVFVGLESNTAFEKRFYALNANSTKVRTLQNALYFLNLVKTPFFLMKPLNQKLVQLKNDEYLEQLRRYNIDLIVYLGHYRHIIDFPFCAVNWDIGHCSTFAFPEMVHRNMLMYRKDWYDNIIPCALNIFVESNASVEEFQTFYPSIAKKKIKVLPLFGSNLSTIEGDLNFLEQHNLKKNHYFFYPAQFWAHKNHYNLVLAFKEFIKKHPDYKLALTGSDKGNYVYIQSLVIKLGLEKAILFLGFVNNEELVSLYKNATALVMPTLLGPTNMPLLEARNLSCPVICTDFKGHREQLGQGAIYCDTENYQEITKAMEFLIIEDNRLKLLEIAKLELENSPFKIEVALAKLNSYLLDLIKIKRTWN
jgi:glycosyltransferase involved in cell wall biosynthesis